MDNTTGLKKSISYDQNEIIQNIMELYVPEKKIDIDMTYGNGCFYKNTNIHRPTFCYDLNPKEDCVEKQDCRSLPLDDNSASCIMFDPPFLATSGSSLKNSDDNNVINKRFGVYSNEKELHSFYVDAMNEAYRLLRQDGILIFKCQDKVSSGKQYMSHVYIMNEAVKIGFYPKDLFILLAKNRIVAEWQKNKPKAFSKISLLLLGFSKVRHKNTIRVK